MFFSDDIFPVGAGSASPSFIQLYRSVTSKLPIKRKEMIEMRSKNIIVL